MGIAQGLVATCKKRNREYREDTNEYRRTIHDLEEKVCFLKHDFRPEERPMGKETLSAPPQGYVRNPGLCATLVVPTQDGLYRPAKWIKQLDGGRVAMLGSHATLDDEPTITEIFASPDERFTGAYQPMPLWFRQLLTGPGPLYQTLHDGVAETNDWGALADLDRFCTLDNEVGTLAAVLDRTQCDYDAAKFARGLAQSRLEASRIHIKVPYLEGVSMGHPLSRPRSAWKKKVGEGSGAERGLSG
jgi:hypothetical protein